MDLGLRASRFRGLKFRALDLRVLEEWKMETAGGAEGVRL